MPRTSRGPASLYRVVPRTARPAGARRFPHFPLLPLFPHLPHLPLLPLALLVALLAGVPGCGEDIPAECGIATEGEFQFESDTPDTTRFTGTLQTATYFAGGPSWEYVFRTNGNRNIQVLIPEVGPPVPIAEDSVYTVELLVGGPDPHDSFGFKVTDALGLRFLAIADWTPEYSMFVPGPLEPGYRLGGAEWLTVATSDPGCEAIQENTADYLLLRNRRLRFVLTGGASADLYNGQSATLGNWVVHVHKAMEVQPKNPAFIQNQISFSVERAGLRS
jgi:hypothetical protein